MMADEPFRAQPILDGATVRLEPLTEAVADDYWPTMNDPEVSRLTGTHRTFARAEIEEWLLTRREHHDRADWAILRRDDGAFLGEAVINDLDPSNESANYRIWLAGPAAFGRGYGTEATRLVVAYALGEIGLHRLALEVFEHNPRARRVYEKCGFITEGWQRDALLWEGKRYDSEMMAILRTDPRSSDAVPIQ